MYTSTDDKFVTPTLFEICQEYIEAGISIFPLLLDGSKKPAGSWKQYQSRIMEIGVAYARFSSGKYGAATICGAVSGGLEVFDFDREAHKVFPAWHRMVEPIAVRLPIVETPRGLHVYSRCSVVCKNTKIAMDGETTLIETRGEGGYVVNPSSPAAVHKSNSAYIQVAGPVLPEIPEITPEERLELWKAARTFDRSGLYDQQKRQAMPKPHRPVVLHGDEKSRFERARKYLAKMPASVSGQRGHDKAFRAAFVLVDQFGLPTAAALQLMHEFNERCSPPWSDQELRHKVESAEQKVSA